MSPGKSVEWRPQPPNLVLETLQKAGYNKEDACMKGKAAMSSSGVQRHCIGAKNGNDTSLQ